MAAAGAALAQWREQGRVPPTVTEVRNALFAFQRTDHFSDFGQLSSDTAAAFLQALRERVGRGEVEDYPAEEVLPIGYSLSDRLGELALQQPLEGSRMFFGERDEAFFACVDEGIATDQHDDADADLVQGPIKLLRFETPGERDDFLASSRADSRRARRAGSG